MTLCYIGFYEEISKLSLNYHQCHQIRTLSLLLARLLQDRERHVKVLCCSCENIGSSLVSQSYLGNLSIMFMVITRRHKCLPTFARQIHNVSCTNTLHAMQQTFGLQNSHNNCKENEHVLNLRHHCDPLIL